jgi:hypothetical protein
MAGLSVTHGVQGRTVNAATRLRLPAVDRSPDVHLQFCSFIVFLMFLKTCLGLVPCSWPGPLGEALMPGAWKGTLVFMLSAAAQNRQLLQY